MAKVWLIHAEQMFLHYLISILKNKRYRWRQKNSPMKIWSIRNNGFLQTDWRKLHPILLGWPTCACSYGKFSSHLGGVSAKSSEISPTGTGSLLIWTHLYFYKNFLRKVWSHLGELVRLTGPAHLHMNSPLIKPLNSI